MGTRINNNVEALISHRNLLKNEQAVSKSLEKLSSGLAINKASDGPASLVISENMRAQISGLNQAIDNNEAAVSLVQTTEGALNEVNRLLIDIRQRAIHAANEGINDEAMLDADQAEIENALAAIDRIAQTTQFGKNKLLDGSRAANGSAVDLIPSINNQKVVEFVKATANTAATNEGEGYDVVITQNATKAQTQGKLTEDTVRSGTTLSIREGGKLATYVTSATDTVKSAIVGLTSAAKRSGLDVKIETDAQNDSKEANFTITHHEFGEANTIEVRSSTDGVFLNSEGNEVGSNVEVRSTGSDVQGTINGETAVGSGQTLTGKRGNLTTEGLEIRITQEVELNTPVGQVSIKQNALNFQVGANRGQTVSVDLLDASSTQLARSTKNESGFNSLADIDVRSTAGASDALALIDRAIEEVTTSRGEIGAFQKNTLESNLSSLRIASENLTAAESSIRDADMAKELTHFTRNQIMRQSATAQLAQANAMPSNVLRLLNFQ